MRLIFSRSIAASSRHAPFGTSLYLSYGPEGKEGEEVEKREKAAFACVANFGQVREETSRVNVLNVLMSCFLLNFSAKRGVLGHLAGHGPFGAGELFRVSVGAGQHHRSVRAATSRKTYRNFFRHPDRAARCSAGQRRGTIAPKAKAPVLENTFGSAVAAPTESGVLSRPDFLGVSIFGRIYGFGRDGFVRKAGRTAEPVFSTSRPPASLENVACGFETRSGAKTMMTTSPVASRSAAPTTPRLDPIALHGEAINAAAMARWYAARHDYAAAFRRSAQATGALRKLAAFERIGTAMQGA